LQSKTHPAYNPVKTAGLPQVHAPRNAGMALDLDWVMGAQANTSAIERRTISLPGRRSVKKEYQAAWMLKAITCIDLTTLSGDDTAGRVRRLCAKARQPVRADILDAEPFDTGFTGWGWEDSEWAARAVKKYRLKHVDIVAIHLGLETTETLLARFKDSAANYIRFTSAHPDLAKTLTLYKLSQKLKYVPGQKLMRPLLKAVVRSSVMPTKLRLLALKLWRASWYSQAMSLKAMS